MDPQYYRTFIGLPVSVGREALDARREMMDALSKERISWVEPDRYHVTLRFIGDTEVSKIIGIKENLRAEVSIPQPAFIEMAQVGSFGPWNKPRVIWAGFQPTQFINLIIEDVDRALEKCGIHGSEQPFRAHLTLGRVRSLKDLSHFQRTLEELKNRFNECIHIGSVVFYRSTLGPTGPVYSILEEIKF